MNQNKTIEIPIKFPFPTAAGMKTINKGFLNQFKEMESQRKELYAVLQVPYNGIVSLGSIAGIFRTFRTDADDNLFGELEILQTPVGIVLSQLSMVPLAGNVCLSGEMDKAQNGEFSEILCIQIERL